jgi:hypothetical protein
VNDRNEGRIRPVALAVVIALVAAGCGTSPTEPGGGGGGGGGSVTVSSVAVSGTLMLTEGATSQLTATAHKSDGTTENVTNQATWQSSDTMVATVSGTGLVTALQAGTADITASFSSQAGRQTLQIRVARFTVSLVAQSVTALATCDDVTQGLTSGEFATRILAITPGGQQTTVSQTSAYPGNPAEPRGHNLAEGASATVAVTRTFTLDGAAGQFVRVQFNATEWDEQVVVIPPSIRWIHDNRLDDASTSRTHSYANGTFGSLGPNTLTLGNSSCGIRLSYTISAVRQM